MLAAASIPPLVMASVNAYVGLHHLAIYLRTRQARAYLTFALLALGISGYCVACAGLYGAASPGGGWPWEIAQTVALTVAAPLLAFFVADYTGTRHRWPAALLTFGYAGILVAAVVGGPGLIWTHVPQVAHVRLPFGLAVAYNETTAGPLSLAHTVVSLGLFTYAFVVIAEQFRRGERRRALLLGSAIAVLFLAAVNDTLLSFRLIPSIYTLEYAFLAIVVVMGDTLVSEVVRAAKVAESLRESEGRYQRLFSTVPDPVVVFDAETRQILDVNEGAERLYGYSRGEFLRVTHRDITAEPEASDDSVRRTVNGERLGVMLRAHRKRDGTVFPVEISAGMFTFGGRTVLCAVVRDVSERVRVQEVLQREKERFQMLVDSAPFGVISVAPDGTFEFVNRRFTEVFGYDLDDVPSLATWRGLAYPDPDYRRKVADAWNQDWAGHRAGGIAARTFDVRCKDGRVRNVVFYTAELISGTRMMTLEDVTERRRAEEALRASEAELRALFAAMSDVIIVFDREGRYLKIAPTDPSLLYKPAGELIGRKLDEVFPADQAALFLSHITRALETRQTVPVEYNLSIGGANLLFSGAVSPMDANRVILIVRNATEERRLRELQRAIYEISEATSATGTLDELYRSIHAVIGRLMDAKNFYIALHDPSRNLLLFPYFVDEIDPPPEPFEPGRGMTGYVLRSGQPLLATPEVLDQLEKRGEIEPLGSPSIDWIGVPLKAGDHVIGVLAVQSYSGAVRYGEAEKEILTYVSTQVAQAIERKRAEEALRESEQVARALINATSDNAILLNADGSVLVANAMVTDSLDTTPEAIVGADFFAQFEPAVGANRRAFADQVVRTGRPVRFVDQRRGRWFDSTFYPVFDSKGAVTRVAIFARDITEARRAEEAQREADKMHAIGQLAGGVAHDFNNLLQAMLAHTELLHASGSDAHAAGVIASELEEQIRRGAALTRQLLLFSRRESTKSEHLDLNEVTRSAVHMLRRLVREDVAFELDLANGHLEVSADRGQLDQVIMNLVVNASDAMPEGGRLVVRTGRTDPGSVWLEVEDSGHGIPEAILPRIFEPFFTTKSTGKGTGLGLAVVHGIVTSHGGSVDVHSRVGEGTVIRVMLPETASDVRAAAPAPLDVADIPPGQGERILLVEDEASAREGLAQILTSIGYEVMPVGNAEDAVLLAGKPRFDLLLTDLVLPGAHGGELARGLREQWPSLKVIIMSGYTDDETIREGVSRGTMRFLQKPFDMGTLAREVRAALDESPAVD
ncbi:MAG: PAS domain S-box protein [Thermoanaerobaculales bacterium]